MKAKATSTDPLLPVRRAFRRRRRQLELSQAAAAEICDVARTTIIRWETGTSDMTHLVTLEGALGRLESLVRKL